MTFLTPVTGDLAGDLNRLANHPDIYAAIKDDSISGELDFKPLVESSYITAFLVSTEQNFVGFFMFHFTSEAVAEMHCGLLKSFRGRIVIEAGHKALAEIFFKTRCTLITTYAWASSKAAILAARLGGFQEVSRSVWGTTVDSKPVVKVDFQISRGEFNHLYPCPQQL